MTDLFALDKQLVRRAFERAAPGYDAAAVLAREIAGRMSERLDLLREKPQQALDLGSGTGYGAQLLKQRYSGCLLVELDFACAMLLQSRQRPAWWRRKLARLAGDSVLHVCADIERLPFADRAFDMVWSNLALHWVSSPSGAFSEIYRVLRPGGVCMFNSLGPDTLRELRACYADVDQRVHVNRFIDLHDLGDMLVQARFADPVMDMEYLTLTYKDVHTLLRELKATGAHNVNAGRNPALSGRRSFEKMIQAYERHRTGGRLPATFEVVYGHAWRPEVERTREDGRQVIELRRNPLRPGA